MKSWYSKVRDTELIDGSIRATYVVTFETDSIELKREVEKYLQGIMDRADRKIEPQYSEDDMYWLSLAEDVANGKMSDAGANQAWLEYINHKDEPQTCEECEHWNDTEDGCADRHGCRATTEDCSTVPTSSKMEQVDKDINARSKDEPQTERSIE